MCYKPTRTQFYKKKCIYNNKNIENWNTPIKVEQHYKVYQFVKQTASELLIKSCPIWIYTHIMNDDISYSYNFKESQLELYVNTIGGKRRVNMDEYIVESPNEILTIYPPAEFNTLFTLI